MTCSEFGRNFDGTRLIGLQLRRLKIWASCLKEFDSTVSMGWTARTASLTWEYLRTFYPWLLWRSAGSEAGLIGSDLEPGLNSILSFVE